MVASASRGHPLLAPCLNGIGKFSHLIDLDFMADLMNYLRKLAGGGSDSNGSLENSSKPLTVSERLQCCIVAFKVMKSNLDALNIDLQDFFAQLYSLILEYRPGRYLYLLSNFFFAMKSMKLSIPIFQCQICCVHSDLCIDVAYDCGFL